jgi:hypothetical protein
MPSRKLAVLPQKQLVKNALTVSYGMFKKKSAAPRLMLLVDVHLLKFGIALNNSAAALQMLPVLDVPEQANGILCN